MATLKKDLDRLQLRYDGLNLEYEFISNELSEKINNLEIIYNKQEKEIYELEEVIIKQQVIINNLNNMISELEIKELYFKNSTSWKITAPIRKTMDIIRSIRNNGSDNL